MKQAISGVSPSSLGEVEIMTVWPSNSVYALGRLLGLGYAIRAPFGHRVFNVGNLIALISIPLALVLYFMKVLPFIGIRYTVTNRRVVVKRGLQAHEERAVALSRFDTVEIEVQPGQEWYKSGDLVFRLGDEETFRLEGVSRPEAFRRCCLNASRAHTQVKASIAAQGA